MQTWDLPIHDMLNIFGPISCYKTSKTRIFYEVEEWHDSMLCYRICLNGFFELSGSTSWKVKLDSTKLLKIRVWLNF